MNSKLDITEKRIPKNPRYAYVKPSFDTGSSIRKVRQISTKELLRRRSEVFERLKPRAFAGLIEDLSSRCREEEVKEDDNASTCPQTDDVEEILVLDLRSAEEFAPCHISHAVNFPLVCLHQDRMCQEIYRFKNQPNKLIVVYGEDERVASEAATTLLQKRIDNVRMLSGGLRSFGNLFPQHIQGNFPDSLVWKRSPTNPRRRTRKSTGEVSSSYAGSVYSTSSAISLRSTFSRAPRWRDKAHEHKALIMKMHATSHGTGRESL